MSQKRLILLLVAVVIFVIGALTVLQKARSITSHIVQSFHHSGGSSTAETVKSIDQANFDYLVPNSSDWTYDKDKTAFDQTKGVATYHISMKDGNVNVAVSQQQFPDKLKPRGSDAFNAFIDSAKPTRNVDAGDGTVYYLPATQNGVPASTGSDTVIYATNDILLFGQADRVLDFDKWSKLLSSMAKK